MILLFLCGGYSKRMGFSKLNIKYPQLNDNTTLGYYYHHSRLLKNKEAYHAIEFAGCGAFQDLMSKQAPNEHRKIYKALTNENHWYEDKIRQGPFKALTTAIHEIKIKNKSKPSHQGIMLLPCDMPYLNIEWIKKVYNHTLVNPNLDIVSLKATEYFQPFGSYFSFKLFENKKSYQEIKSFKSFINNNINIYKSINYLESTHLLNTNINNQVDLTKIISEGD